MTRLRMLAALAGVLVAALAGGTLGVALGDRASQPAVRDIVVADPGQAVDDVPALRSPGGFTGFEGRPALAGRVFRVGAVDEAGEQSLTVAGDGSTFTVRLRDATRLYRLEPLSEPLATGDVVLVRFEGDDVTGVLRVPPDLHEGDARGQAPVEASPSP